MTNKRNIITLLIMLSLSLCIYGDTQYSKNQHSTQLSINDTDSSILSSFIIIRDHNFIYDNIKIENLLINNYCVRTFTVSESYVYENGHNYTFNGNPISSDLLSIKSYTYSGDISSLENNNVVNLIFDHDNVNVGFYLINKNNPTESYEIVLEISPLITINQSDYIDVTTLQNTLTQNSLYLPYLKKQILGSSSYVATENNPFPIFNLDNDYTYKLNLDHENSLSREEEKINKSSFDVLYNRSVNYFSRNGHAKSLLQNFLGVFFTNNKPLYHHYINDYIENVGESFNYREYLPLTALEGKELVDNALRYLTWGVEYTPDVNYGELSEGENIFPSQILNSDNTVKSWLTSEGQSSNREKNYLPYNPSEINETYNSNDISYHEEMTNKLLEIAGDYFSPSPIDMNNLELTTPFVSGNNEVTGSSLPYVKGGMDSPRTFNYKMLQQYQIISDYLEDGDDSYKPWYGKEEDGWSINNHYFSLKGDGSSMSPLDFYFYNYNNFPTNEHKPFVPGYDRNEDYQYMNLTGVDSLGLLSGALAMTSYYDDVYGLPNKQKFIDLDNYYSMSLNNENPASPFLDETGKPKFERTGLGNNYINNYNDLRFNRLDIERSTIIVPNLRDIQVGDLLVNTKNSETEVAIVVDTGYNEGDTSFHLSNVLVLSVNELDGRVSLNYWGNGGTYSSFTDTPKDFIVRRLIKFNSEEIDTPSDFGEDDVWDPFSNTNLNYKTVIDYSNSNNYGRWIANTGEVFILDTIKFYDGETLFDGEVPVFISGLTDINYDTEESLTNNSTSGNNVKINRGDGFEFFAVDIDGEDVNYIKLATFRINTNSQNAQDRYFVEYNSDIFNSDGNCKENFSLFTDGDKLCFTYNEDPEDLIYQFGIRPLSTNIRPGDDIALNFDLLIDNKLTAAPGTSDNSLAVYDKKMLWRANLYIKEESDDWNDVYPWNAPSTGDIKGSYAMSDEYSVSFKEFISGTTELTEDDTSFVFYGKNEWNKRMEVLNDTVEDDVNIGANHYAYDTSGVRRWEDLSQLTDGNGKQVVNIPSTMFYKSIRNIPDYPETIIENGVVYNFVRTTTPFEFYYHMQQQNQAMKNQETLDNNSAEIVALQDAVTTAETNLLNATDENRNELKTILRNAKRSLKDEQSIYTDIGEITLPPDNNWLNYVRTSYVPSYKDYSNYIDSLPADNPLHENLFYPSQDIVYPFEDAGSNNALEAGVDCGGLIYAAEMYEGTPYMSTSSVSARTGYREIHDCDESVPADYTTPYNYKSNNLWYISHKGNLENELDIEESLGVNLIPGDIVYYSEGDSYHVMIVQDVEVDDLHNDISSRSIKIIESTYGQEVEFETPLFGVGKIRTLGDPELFGKNWIIGRLKTE